MEADPRSYVKLAGLTEAGVANISRAADCSARQLTTAREALARTDSQNGVAIAVGSLGRQECTEASDLDIAFLHDGSVARGVATEQCGVCVRILREAGFDVSEKMFAKPKSIDELVANVGGRFDTNDDLTHRILILTESSWLQDAGRTGDYRERIFDAYRAGSTQGRYLESLLNELIRYYRQLCVDYRHKVEIEGKGWAVRNMKLRHCRKLWHLANIALHSTMAVVDIAEEDRNGWLAERTGLPPLSKLAIALDVIRAGDATRDVWRAYDNYLRLIGDPSVRFELNTLGWTARQGNAIYEELRASAHTFQDACVGVVDALQATPVCREQFLKFAVL
jgi:hypothetical protein